MWAIEAGQGGGEHPGPNDLEVLQVSRVKASGAIFSRSARGLLVEVHGGVSVVAISLATSIPAIFGYQQ